MQFTRENAEKVMEKAKTQTRRVVKPWEFASGVRSEGICAVWVDFHHFEVRDPMQFGFTRAPLKILESIYRLKWARAIGPFVDKTYAVCPGRGKPSIGRIRLLSIRKEKLQDINDADICAELGCPVAWADSAYPEPYHRDLRAAFANLWDSINPKGKRWADNPDVWVLTFEAVQ